MNWEDECFLLAKRKFRENANIINVFTKNRGKIVGIVFGGNSRKIRNYLQISNKLFVINNSKNENKVGYLQTELVEAVSPIYFNNKKKMSALISFSSLLNSLLPEYQPQIQLYKSFEKFIKNLKLENWILTYILLELNLIKELGFDTDLGKFKKELNNDEYIKVNIDGRYYTVPSFLIDNEFPEKIEEKQIKSSLIFTRNLMLNNFFLPNNMQFPQSRVLFEKYFN